MVRYASMPAGSTLFQQGDPSGCGSFTRAHLRSPTWKSVVCCETGVSSMLRLFGSQDSRRSSCTCQTHGTFDLQYHRARIVVFELLLLETPFVGQLAQIDRGDPPGSCYILLTGTVTIWKYPDVKKKKLAAALEAKAAKIAQEAQDERLTT